jgi:hypothetical protein
MIGDLTMAIEEVKTQLSEKGISDDAVVELAERVGSSDSEPSLVGLSTRASAVAAFAAKYEGLPRPLKLICVGPGRICGERADLCCGGCRSRNYCSEACQRGHWTSGHKEECRAMQAVALATTVAVTASQ